MYLFNMPFHYSIFALIFHPTFRKPLLYFQNPHKPSKYKHFHPFYTSKNLPYLPIIKTKYNHTFKTKFASKDKIDISIHLIANRNHQKKMLFFLRLHLLHIHVTTSFSFLAAIFFMCMTKICLIVHFLVITCNPNLPLLLPCFHNN